MPLWHNKDKPENPCVARNWRLVLVLFPLKTAQKWGLREGVINSPALKGQIFSCQFISNNSLQFIAQTANLFWHRSPYLPHTCDNTTCIFKD